MQRRIKLNTLKQKEIINLASNKVGSLKRLSEKAGVKYSTMKNYSSGDRLLPEYIFDFVLNLLKKRKDEIDFNYLDAHWGSVLGGKRGIVSLQNKYPHKILKWRTKSLQKARKLNVKKIKTPKLDENLAEFIGIYLGDGTITKYFLRISGDYRYDLPYFNYLKNLVYNLFGLESSILKDKRSFVNTAYFTIYSKNLCSFLRKEFRIKPGHKIRNNTLIPNKILKNSKLSLACLRGLIDTDGSVSRRGRKGEQFTITFDSHNKNLIRQVNKISARFGLFTFVSKNKDQIGTNSYEKILNYFKLVGSSNLRHIVRFYEKFYRNNTIYQKEVIKYYQKDFYRGLKFPFKIIQDPVG